MILANIRHSKLVWDAFLLALCIISCITFSVGFFPGRAELDIVTQANQALAKSPLMDWHPPIMAVVWRALYLVTGTLGSLLVLQISLYFLGALLFSVYTHRKLRSKVSSIAVLSCFISPWSLSQLNIMWKDTQMTVTLLAACGFVSLISRRNRWSFTLLLPVIFLLTYAIGVRKNAVAALLPICIYIAWILLLTVVPQIFDRKLSRRLSKWIVPVGGVLLSCFVIVCSFCIGASIDSIWGVEKRNQVSQIMLDDVMFSVPEAELNGSDAPDELKDHINSSRSQCIKMKEIWDAYWNCYGMGETGRPFSSIKYQDELRALWFEHVVTHPVRYLEYRSAVFSYYLFSSKLEYYPYGADKRAQTVGLGGGSRNFDYIVRPYVEDFGVRTFPMVFKPWFWLILAFVCTLIARKQSLVRAPVWMLSGSSILYILAYFPTVPANVFRYTYWPAIAVTVSVALVFCAWRTARVGKMLDRNLVRSDVQISA